MGEGELEKNGFLKKGNLFISIFFKFEKKINFKQFAVLNAFFLKKSDFKKNYKKNKNKMAK